MLAISFCSLTLASWARASCCWYHCLSCWRESISAWEVFSRLCKVLRSSWTCWSWLWSPPICWRKSWTAKADERTCRHDVVQHVTENATQRLDAVSPVLSLEATVFCISSTLTISLLYWSSATFKSLPREARLAFLLSRFPWSSIMAFSSWLQLCRSVPTSTLSAPRFSWLNWASSVLACSWALTAASWACSSVFSLRAWRTRQWGQHLCFLFYILSK